MPQRYWRPPLLSGLAGGRRHAVRSGSSFRRSEARAVLRRPRSWPGREIPQAVARTSAESSPSPLAGTPFGQACDARHSDRLASDASASQAPGRNLATRSMKIPVRRLRPAPCVRSGDPGQGPSWENAAGQAVLDDALRARAFHWAAPATCSGCALSTYRSLSFARSFSDPLPVGGDRSCSRCREGSGGSAAGSAWTCIVTSSRSRSVRTGWCGRSGG